MVCVTLYTCRLQVSIHACMHACISRLFVCICACLFIMYTERETHAHMHTHTHVECEYKCINVTYYTHAGLSFKGAGEGERPRQKEEQLRQLWAWGDNAGGQCGNGTRIRAQGPELWGSHLHANAYTYLPRQRADALNAERLSAALREGPVIKMDGGDAHSAVIAADGSLWVCGSSRRGQLGVARDEQGGGQYPPEYEAAAMSVTCPMQVIALKRSCLNRFIWGRMRVSVSVSASVCRSVCFSACASSSSRTLACSRLQSWFCEVSKMGSSLIS